MKFSRDLFDLIKSLKPPEKRFFKVISCRHVIGERNNYVLLFDAINDMKEYDEELLKQQIKGEPFVKHLATEKFRLYELILKSLRGYRERGNALCEIQSMVREVEILTENELYNQARRRLGKAKELAGRHGDFLSLLRLLTLERMHLQHSQEPDIRRRFRTIEEETAAALRGLSQQAGLQNLYDLFFSYARGNLRGNNADLLREIETLSGNPLLRSDEGYSFHNRLLFHSIYALCYQMKGELRRAFALRESIVHLWEQEPARIRDNPRKFITALANLVSCCISLGDAEAYQNTLRRLELLRPAAVPASVSTEIEHNIYHLKLLHALNSGTIDEEPVLPVLLASWMETHGNRINSARYLTIHYNLGVFHFLSGDYPAALRHLEKALSSRKTAARKDIQAGARLITAIIYYEQRDMAAARSRHSSARSFIIQHKLNLPYLAVVLELVKELLDCTRAAEVRELCRTALAALRPPIQNAGMSNPIGSAELLYWLESRCTGRSMAAILKDATANRTGRDTRNKRMVFSKKEGSGKT